MKKAFWQKHLVSFFLFAAVLGFSFSAFATATQIQQSTLAKFTGTSTTNGPGAMESNAAVGDFNCDGVQDIFLSAPGYAGGKGRIYVYFGGSGFTGITQVNSTTADVSIKGDLSGDGLGHKFFVLNADEDSNDCDDIVSLETGSTFSKVVVIPGSTSWTTANFNDSIGNITNVTVTTVEDAYSGAYGSMHMLGAIDGDANADGVIDNKDNHVAVCNAGLLGGLCNLFSIDSLLTSGTFVGKASYFINGEGVADKVASGDFDADGNEDLVFAEGTYTNGSANIVYGPISGSTSIKTQSAYSFVVSNYFEAGDLQGSDVVIWDADNAVGGFGSYLDSSNVFGDAGDDLVIGAPYEACGPLNEAGRYHFIRSSTIQSVRVAHGGGPGGVQIYNDTTTGSYNYSNLDVVLLGGDQSNSSFGGSGTPNVSADINGDGKTDLILGSPAYYDTTPEGIALITYGGDFNSLIGQEFHLTATQSGPMYFQSNVYMEGDTTTPTADLVGGDVVHGDFTGDGIDDLIFVTPGAGTYGETYLYPGAVTDLDGDGIDSAWDPDGDGVFEPYDCDEHDAATGGPQTYYTDVDGDGFGNPSSSIEACSPPAAAVSYVLNDQDCDDTDPLLNPGSAEVCDGIDNDCSGAIDDGLPTSTYYADSDGDGYGDPSVSLANQCSAPSGYVLDATDCNDGASLINPGAPEVCDGVDNDCSGGVDEGVTTTYYQDFDGDGFGNAVISTEACTTPSGYVLDATDCNDTSGSVNPGEAEVCDGVDNDCSGGIDEGVLNTYYQDNDADGQGNPSVTSQACTQPAGYVVNDQDCDDTSGTIYTGAPELCDSIDNDCDGSVDESVTTATFYADSDGDGYGDPTVTQVSCNVPVGYVLNDQDCDDSNNSVSPASAEVCDGVDNDCSGGIDEGVTTTFYADGDGDGFGDLNTTVDACSEPSGYVSDFTDCDDTDATINTSAAEICGDGLDNNCVDGVDDGCSGGPIDDLDADGFTIADGDCNDNNAAIYPGASELGDALDNDCDGRTDESLIKAKVNAPVGTVNPGDTVTLNVFYQNNTGFSNFDVEVYMLKSSYQDYTNTSSKKKNRKSKKDKDKSNRLRVKKSLATASINPWHISCGSTNQSCNLVGSENGASMNNDGFTHSVPVEITIPNTADANENYGIFIKFQNPTTGDTQFTITPYNDTVRDFVFGSFMSPDPFYVDAVNVIAQVQ